MNIVASIEETELSTGMGARTREAFLPLLEARRAEIEQYPMKSFQYGPRSRNHLDVYYPLKALTPSGKLPILFFIYGGSFNSGSRTLADPYSLMYRSLATFFTERGFVVIIPDYHLVPEVRFPTSAVDVHDAILWTTQNLEKIREDAIDQPDVGCMFLMGHSAGATHAVTAILYPELLKTLPPLRGVIISGGAYCFKFPDGDISHSEVLAHYFGEPEQMRSTEPLGLLNNAEEDIINGLPDILMVEAEREPGWMKVTGAGFAKALEERLKKPTKKIIGVGHNHVSGNWALGSGEGDEWGRETYEWMRVRIPAA